MSKKRYRKRDHQTHFGVDWVICRICGKLIKAPKTNPDAQTDLTGESDFVHVMCLSQELQAEWEARTQGGTEI